MGLPFEPRKAAVAPKTVIPHFRASDYVALSESEWQRNAAEFCAYSFSRLWSAEGMKAWQYLEARGIKPELFEAAYLGYNPEDQRGVWGSVEVWLPRGIVIPWQIEGYFWKVNIRRPTGEPKYIQVRGGANGLYNAVAVQPLVTVVMIEWEFDSLVLRQYPGIVPVATGATSGARNSRWLSLLGTAGLIALAFDVDENEAGEKTANWWKEQLRDKAIRLTPPAHDVTDAWKAGIDLWQWIEPYSLYPARESTPEELANRVITRKWMESQNCTFREGI